MAPLMMPCFLGLKVCACYWDPVRLQLIGQHCATCAEENCEVTLEGCIPGLCYSIFDLTLQLPMDPVQRSSSSLLASFSLVNAREDTWNATEGGIHFVPASSTVTIKYSTISCAEFYSFHGRQTEQDCSKGIQAISQVTYGVPRGCEFAPLVAAETLTGG